MNKVHAAATATTLGPYCVLGMLGEGGFGRVYRASDSATGDPIALKELNHRGGAALARFKQEFRALRDFRHPNVVRMLELFEHDGRWFIAMELVEGVDWLTWVRNGVRSANDNERPFDLLRLKTSLLAVAQGLAAVHAEGLLHRDLKPENIRVTSEGRPVLLDFGLLTELSPVAQSTQAGIVGSPAYMAPEQAKSEKVTAAADWYSFGVCLYEALTGAIPFNGANAVSILLAKQNAPPRPPREVVENPSLIPAALEELCMRLLASDPNQRAGELEVLQALGQSDALVAVSASRERALFSELDDELTSTFASGPLQDAAGPGTMLSGRDSELEFLARAAANTQQGALRVVLVEGESGIGKSALINEAARVLLTSHRDTLVLKGRCYENERVPYKAFDGCMDQLARALRRFSPELVRTILPPRARLIAQLFPVLTSVKQVAASSDAGASAEPSARRLEAFRALSNLLHKLALERRLILLIDDLQWADLESFRLLRSLLDEAPPLLILFTVRPRDELSGETATEIHALRERPNVSVLPITGLPPVGARELAARMLPHNATPEWLEAIASESNGHPLFIDVLTRYAASHELGEARNISLDAALAARLTSIGPTSRRLLELLALLGRPHDRGLLARALGAPFDQALAPLLAQKFVRARGTQQIVCFHDRIRALVVQQLGAGARMRLHRDLATALAQQEGTDPSEAAEHWEQAGERVKAAEGYERAGDNALRALAFARAAEAYQQALNLTSEPAARQRLTVQRAHALAKSGRSAEAAVLYREAAQRVEGPERVRLGIWTAQHLLQSAQVAQGADAAHDLLRELDMGLPRSQRAALTRVLWNRTRIRLRGLELTPPPAGPLDARTQLQLEAAWQLSVPMAWVDVLCGANLSVTHLSLALDAGDPAHAARALAQEANFRALQKPLERQTYEPLLETSRRLANQVGAPGLDAFITWVEGLAAQFRGDWTLASELCAQAEQILHQRCADEPWLLVNVRGSLGISLQLVGKHAELARGTTAWLAEAAERDDRFAHTALYGFGFGFYRYLMADAPDEALVELERSIAVWPREPFSTASLGELGARVPIELYRAGNLHGWLTRERPRQQRALILKAPMMRNLLAWHESSAALAAMVITEPRKREELDRVVRRGIRTLERGSDNLAIGNLALIEAQRFAAMGEQDRALRAAARAREAFWKSGACYQHAAGYLEGLLEKGEAGREKCAAALEFYRQQGWKRPDRALQMIIPILPALEAPEARSPAPTRPLFAGRFEALNTLGHGGYGSVTGARDITTGRRVAIKELTRTNPQALFRFKREFRALQTLRHPRLARLDALFELEGKWFIAMQWVEGTDLRTWVRPNGVLDAARVREAFAELSEGVAALHEAGFCHRDIKPENVRVTPEGRVVLLDFGLIADLSSELDENPEVGTAAYMAPEQTPFAPIGPEADLYAIGVCLYEGLCGRLPFDGDLPVQIMHNKRRGGLPPRPSAWAPYEDIPDDLEELALELLAPLPGARPAAATLPTRLLRQPSAPQPSSSILPRKPKTTPFAGRDAQLTLLDAELARAQAGATRVVLFEGESGIGKSALTEHWLTRLRDTHPDAQILRGRCYENEHVPYSALDGVVDELSRLLRRLPSDTCEALLPQGAAVLAELFAVLGSVRPIGEAPRKGVLADPHARRLQGFAALRSLLVNISTRAPLVLVVDDLQWADLESFRLLHDLLREDVTPPLLLIATVRPQAELSPDLGHAIAEVCAWPCSTRNVLGPLSEADARAVIAGLFEQTASDVVQRIVTQAQGHPLFLGELASHARGAPDAELLTLDAAVSARLQALDDTARKLLELIALAGRPHGLDVYERALSQASAAPYSLDEAVAVISAAQLVRVRKDQQLLCYHDRIRAVAARSVPEVERPKLHLALARALDDEPGSDPAERARLWDVGGDPGRAVAAYEEAGNAALEALAFAQAALLFARAIELTGKDVAAQHRLMVLRAHSLARGGRSGEAAALYQQAAEQVEGPEQVRLGIWAAQHLLQSAQVEKGMEASRALLEGLDMGLPRGETAAIARIIWDRTRLSFRGLALKPAPKEGVDPRTRLQLEAAWQLSAPVAWVEVLPSANLSAAHLSRALDAGDPAHAARALAQEATLRAVQKPLARAAYEPLLETSRSLAAQTGDPALLGFVTWAEGITATFRGEFPLAQERCGAAERILSEQCQGEPWLLTNVRASFGNALFFGGEHKNLLIQSRPWLLEAKQRDDCFAQTALIGLGAACCLHLMNDAPDAALEELQQSMRAWPREPFSSSSLGELFGMANIELYRGGPGLHRWLEGEKPRFRKALFLKTPMCSFQLAYISASAAIAAATSASERTDLLSEVRAYVRQLARAPDPFARGSAAMISAQVHVLRGEHQLAIESTRRAREVFEVLGFYHQHAASYLEGALEGGETGRGRCAAALNFFRNQGWQPPERAMATVLPVFRELR